MKLLLKLTFATLLLTLVGSKLTGQSTWLYQIPSISPDTVLVLDKKAAAYQANFNLTHIELRHRFAAALKRQDKLIEVWEATENQLARQKSINKNLKQQVVELEELADIRVQEATAITNACKNMRRKSFVNGSLIGLLVGVVGTTLILTR